jgi:hypothetical protein
MTKRYECLEARHRRQLLEQAVERAPGTCARALVLSNRFYHIFIGTVFREQPAVFFLFGVGSDRTSYWL